MKYTNLFLIVLLLFNGCQPATVTPDEAKTAYIALDKLKIATDTGVDISTYNRLLIDAKSSVNLAVLKLPPVTQEISQDDYGKSEKGTRLMILSDSLEKAVQAYDDAGKILQNYPNEVKQTIAEKHGLRKTEADPQKILHTIWDDGRFYTLKSAMMLVEN